MSNKNNEIEKIAVYLEKRANRSFILRLFDNRGICYLLEHNTNWHNVRRKYDLPNLYACFREWPKYSGNPAWPVPHKKLNPSLAYNILLLWVGKYGRSRRDLALWLAKRLRDEQNI